VGEHPVCLDVGRPAGGAVAADVDRDGTEAGRGERWKLVAPGPPTFGEPMDENQQRPVAPLDRMDVPARDRKQPIPGSVDVVRVVHAR
jgi:hypothetical protein